MASKARRDRTPDVQFTAKLRPVIKRDGTSTRDRRPANPGGKKPPKVLGILVRGTNDIYMVNGRMVQTRSEQRSVLPIKKPRPRTFKPAGRCWPYDPGTHTTVDRAVVAAIKAEIRCSDNPHDTGIRTALKRLGL